ncbi:MAG: Holliday junction resolvase RuvX [Holosporales bacterium]|jgi:putative Holliday junction resolvase|nr:Holliday junction resolvase RuvX [Holosporales bacterium]
MITTINSIYIQWKDHPNNRKLIGIDWGEKRIGIAVSDRSGLIASPLCTVNYRRNKACGRKGHNMTRRTDSAPKKTPQKSAEQLLEETVKDILDIINAEAPIAVNIGLPVNMDGSHGFQAEKVQHFADVLSQSVSVPIILTDERLSSAAVEKSMIQADLTRLQRAKRIDQTSAAYVLQQVVDHLRTFA